MLKNNINISNTIKGFTLVEILLALTISSVLILGINASYQQAYVIWSNAENKRPVYHAVRMIADTLKNEISCSYIPPKSEDENEQSKAFLLSNIPDQGTEFTFYTLSPSWKSDLKSSRPAKVTYRFTRESETGQQVLERIEQPYSCEKEIGQESVDLITRDLSEFKIQIVESNKRDAGGTLSDSHEPKETPPKAIKVSISSNAEDSSTSINFECYFLVSIDSMIL